MQKQTQTVGTKTKKQVKAIWGLARQAGIDDDTLHAKVLAETDKDSIRALSRAEADKVIVALGGTAFTKPRGQSKRNQQYQRKAAGIVALISGPQRALLTSLSQIRWPNSPATSLAAFCASEKIIGKPAPQTTAEANKVIQILKQKNKAEGLG